jgi:hypothetical protein
MDCKLYKLDNFMVEIEQFKLVTLQKAKQPRQDKVPQHIVKSM